MGAARPWIVDFSFAELGATQRQIALDVAELLASLAVIAGADRAVAAAAAVIGPDQVAAAVPLLQPLALSAGTRRAIARQDGLLTQTRQAAAAPAAARTPTWPASSASAPGRCLRSPRPRGRTTTCCPNWPRCQAAGRRCSRRTGPGCRWSSPCRSVTYLASAIGLMGAIPQRIRLWPTVLAQGASSFINRVSPANVGGMALNARYLQKSGVEPTAGVAAVGVNSLAGVIVHLILTVIFFAWSSRRLGQSFKLPSTSTLLAILAVILAVIGIVLATRPGRRFAKGTLVPGLRSAAASLSRVARNPGKMTMLFGGSALVTLAYLGAFAASVEAFGGGTGLRRSGRRVPGHRGGGRRRPHPRWHRRLRGGRGRRPDRCRHGSRSRGIRGAAAPAGHLLAPGGTGLAGLARPATAGVRVKPDPKLRAACIWLVIALAACAFPRRQRLVRRRRAGLASRADHPFSAAPTVLGRHANHAPAATCPAVGYGLPLPS